ncbi:MAG: DMT family transporter [Proteobacteria bacterium]|nr:DMT family transporter [Pseudomonadota bacterium]
MQSTRVHRLATARLVAGAVTLSFAPVLVKLIDMPATVSAFYRTLAGGIILTALVWGRGHKLISGRSTLVALIGAGVMFAADLAVWHRSILSIGPGLATLLGNFQVFAMALVGVCFFGERLRWQLAVSIPMAITGLAMIVGLDWSVFDDRYRWGVLFGLMTAAAYTGYLLFLRQARMAEPDSAPIRDLAVTSLVSAACLGLGGLAEGSGFAIPSLADAGWLMGYTVSAQILGWVLISSSLAHVPASRVGLILLLQPALAFGWDVLFFARSITAVEAAGAGLALFAIFLGTKRGA